MKWRYVLFAVILLAGVLLRVPRLDLRPMHVDEAVHAIKFGDLLERHVYQYDPFEYHGPTLNYFTLISARLASAATLVHVSESTLRIVPVVFGILLILLTLPFARDNGAFLIAASLLTALSPAMVFYSRYYIQEMLLVFFTFCAMVSGWYYARTKKAGWVIACGVSLGLMHATKETSIIAAGAMAVAAAATVVMRPREERAAFSLSPAHAAIGIVSAAATSMLFFSSFFTRWQGVVDSLAAYTVYVTRAGSNGLHVHPWYYYLQMLAFWHAENGPVWSEGAILLLACAGLVAVLAGWTKKAAIGRDTGRFIAVYAVLMTIVYSIIPYKTPWSMLGALHALILLGAVGFAGIVAVVTNRAARAALVAALVLGGIHLGWQAWQASYRYSADPVNPYVYAHSLVDVVTLANVVGDVARSTPEGDSTAIQVASPGDDYWPLPWYLRAFPNVGWWNTIADDMPSAPIIIASPEFEQALVRKLYESAPPGQKSLYIPLFAERMQLRPGVEIRAYARFDVWEHYRQTHNPAAREHPGEQ